MSRRGGGSGVFEPLADGIKAFLCNFLRWLCWRPQRIEYGAGRRVVRFELVFVLCTGFG